MSTSLWSGRVKGSAYCKTKRREKSGVNIGMIRLKTVLTERWDNIGKDPRRPRVFGRQKRTTLAIAPPAWPELIITYARDSFWSSLEPIGVAPQRNLMDTVEAALSYDKSKWDARLFSIYSVNHDRLRLDGKSVGLTHAISGSYRPTERITIASTVSIRADHQRWSGVRLETPSASLALTYLAGAAFKMTAFGSYSRTRNSDGLVDTSTSRMTSVFTWVCQNTSTLRTTLSLDASYTAWLDAIQPSYSTEYVSGLLRFQVAAL
ncbi:MAG: hypothetical protein ACREJU_04155 [Nitrospiraceae bacterium]